MSLTPEWAAYVDFRVALHRAKWDWDRPDVKACFAKFRELAHFKYVEEWNVPVEVETEIDRRLAEEGADEKEAAPHAAPSPWPDCSTKVAFKGEQPAGTPESM